jgi:hypothetical protein
MKYRYCTVQKRTGAGNQLYIKQMIKGKVSCSVEEPSNYLLLRLQLYTTVAPTSLSHISFRKTS